MWVDDAFQAVKGSPAVIPDGDFRYSGSGHAMVLAGYKVPREIRFEPIPKTSTGKIQKFQLRERAKSASAIE